MSSSEFCESKRKILSIMFYLEQKVLPGILDVRSSFTDQVPTFDEPYHILESCGITRPVYDPEVVRELKSCLVLLGSSHVQATKPVVESASVQATESVESASVQATKPVVESASVQATEPVVESASVQAIVESVSVQPIVKSDHVKANKYKRPYTSIELNTNNPNANKKIKQNCRQKVQFVPIKNYLVVYIKEYNRIHPTIHHYLYNKKQELFEFCTKCRGSYVEKNMVLKVNPRLTLSISEIQEYYDNFEKRKGLIRYIKYLMALREYENVVYIHINFKSFYGCMEIVIQKFKK
jgi:hypothetical protein